MNVLGYQVQLFFDRKLLYVQRLLHNFDVDCNAWNEAVCVVCLRFMGVGRLRKVAR